MWNSLVANFSKVIPMDQKNVLIVFTNGCHETVLKVDENLPYI